MAPRRWDVAIVGAGPAGAAAARAAAAAGARTLLLERAPLPRYKRCGGGLLGLSAATSGLDLVPLTRDEITTVAVTRRLGARWVRSEATPFLPMVMREAFDAALVARAQEAGAELRDGVLVTGVEETKDAVMLQLRDGPPIRARHVIAADGSSSRLAASIGVRLVQTDLGLEGEFPAPAGWRGRMWLDFGPVPGSYGWLFPKGDTVTVGVIGNRDQAAALRSYYAAVLAHLLLGPALLEGGHHTRVRTPGSPLVSASARILLVGDAAGWLEPWTREGISFALRSGRLAGEAVAAGEPRSYAVTAQSVLGAEVAAGRHLLSAFERAPNVFHAAFGSPPGWRQFRRVLAGQASLAGLATRLPVRLAVGAARWHRD